MIALWGVTTLVLSAQPASSGRSDPPSELHIAAAADLRFALDELAREFEAKRPTTQIKLSYGSSGSFFAMIQNQAPFDLFFSADIHYPQKLVEAGLGADTNVFLYGIGRLVLWVPADSKVDIEQRGVRALLDPAIRKIAIANPKHAPYGRAAEAALKAHQIYDQVQSKLVFGENIGQALQFVQSGAAEIGVIALSLVQARQLKGQGRFWEVPLHSYPKMEQGGLILKRAKDPESARAFREFVLSKSGRAVLKRYGFFLPEE